MEGQSQSDQDQDHATEEFASPLQPGTELVPELQANERHPRAGGGDHQRGQQQGDMVEAERKAHHQVIQAERKAREEQAGHPLHPLLFVPLAPSAGLLAGLPQGVASGEDEQARSDVGADVSQQSGELAAQEQPQNGHQRLEEAKDQTGFEPGARVDARQTNTNGSGEVQEAKGKTHQEQARPGEGRRRGCGEGPHDHTLLPDLSACAMSLYPTFSACRLTRGRQCSQWKATRGLS